MKRNKKIALKIGCVGVLSTVATIYHGGVQKRCTGRIRGTVMQKHFLELINYWQYKIIASLMALVFTDSFFKLITVFVLLEALDILTRWLAQSKACFKALYPQTQAGVWRYIRFMWQARKWRYIRSDGLRGGVDKILTYLLLLLTASLVDTALTIGHATAFTLTTCVVAFLATTEGMSIIENISEVSDYGVISKIKEKLKCNMQRI